MLCHCQPAALCLLLLGLLPARGELALAADGFFRLQKP